MITLTTRTTTTEDVEWVASHLREADLEEVKASTGRSPLETLTLGVDGSIIHESILADSDKPIAIFGVVETAPNTAAVWMLGTKEIETHAKPWLRQSKKAMSELNEKYELLYSYVDARNTLHIRWLKWVGYSFIAKHENYGYEQRLFYEIVRINK